MNPIEKDLRSYFGITSESNILEHYGTKRHSGRYVVCKEESLISSGGNEYVPEKSI